MEKINNKELRQICKLHNVRKYSKMKKPDLIEPINNINSDVYTKCKYCQSDILLISLNEHIEAKTY